MASKQTVNFVIYGVVAFFVAASAYIMLAKHGGISGGGGGDGLYISGSPRTAKPLGNFTHNFQPKAFSVEGGKANLTYYWLEPQGAPYPAGLKFPLVIVLHGAPGFAYAGEYLGAQKMQLAYPAFVAVPVLPREMKWDMPDTFPDVQGYRPLPEKQKGLPYAVQLAQHFVAKYPIDTKRIYIIGCDDGGVGVLGAAARYPDMFAAGVAISGTWNADDGAQMAKMPLWVIHGAEDDVFRVGTARQIVNSVKQAGGTVAYNEIADMGHECSAPRLYAQATWDWLFSQHK